MKSFIVTFAISAAANAMVDTAEPTAEPTMEPTTEPTPEVANSGYYKAFEDAHRGEGLVRRLQAGDQPSHDEIKDLAKLTEEVLAEDDYQLEKVMAETGLSIESIEEYGLDIIVDMMSSLPEDMFLKLQLDILNERLGEMECMRDDNGDCFTLHDTPSVMDIVRDMKAAHGMVPEEHRRRIQRDWTFWVNWTGELLGGLLNTISTIGGGAAPAAPAAPVAPVAPVAPAAPAAPVAPAPVSTDSM